MLAVMEPDPKVSGKPPKLRRLAKVLVDGALEGDMAALKEVGDRLDGKPKQSSDVNVTGDPLKALYERIVDRSKAGD